MISHRLDDELEELRVDRDRMPCGVTVDARQRAVGFVVTHQTVDAVDFVERFVDDARQCVCVRTIHFDGVLARHRDAAAFVMGKMDPLDRGCVVRRSRERQGDECRRAAWDRAGR